MSAQDEIPTGRTWGYVSHLHARIEELEAELAKVTAERDAWRERLLALLADALPREELATMRAAQEFTRVVCELLGNEGSGMDVSTDVLQDMLTAAGVTL